MSDQLRRLVDALDDVQKRLGDLDSAVDEEREIIREITIRETLERPNPDDEMYFQQHPNGVIGAFRAFYATASAALALTNPSGWLQEIVAKFRADESPGAWVLRLRELLSWGSLAEARDDQQGIADTRGRVASVMNRLNHFRELEISSPRPTTTPEPPAPAESPADSSDEPEPPVDRQALENAAIAELMAVGPNMARIARGIGQPRSTLYGWPRFRRAFDMAKATAEGERSRRRGRRDNGDDFATDGD